MGVEQVEQFIAVCSRSRKGRGQGRGAHKICARAQAHCTDPGRSNQIAQIGQQWCVVDVALQRQCAEQAVEAQFDRIAGKQAVQQIVPGAVGYDGVDTLIKQGQRHFKTTAIAVADGANTNVLADAGVRLGLHEAQRRIVKRPIEQGNGVLCFRCRINGARIVLGLSGPGRAMPAFVIADDNVVVIGQCADQGVDGRKMSFAGVVAAIRPHG